MNDNTVAATNYGRDCSEESLATAAAPPPASSSPSAPAPTAAPTSAPSTSDQPQQEQQQNEGPVKQFSDKSLQELADYYLNLEPADIPDTGFVVSGIAGRFPNADNLNELWENLLNGRDMVLGPDDKRWPLGKLNIFYQRIWPLSSSGCNFRIFY